MEDKGNIVIVGGGVAGKTLAAALLKRKIPANLTVIEQKEYFEVPFAQLRGLTDPEGFGGKIRKPLAELLPGVEIFQGRALGLSREAVTLEDGRAVAYDWLVLATGSSFGQWPFLKGNEKTIAEREAAFRSEGLRIAKAGSILIIGGGPVGVELAGEIAAKWPEKQLTLVQGGARLLNALSAKMSSRTERVLTAMGVAVLTGKKLTKLPDGSWQDAGGATYTADLVIPAVGGNRNTEWIRKGSLAMVNASGAVEVEPDLRVKGQNNVFALGDINDVPEIKLGALAARQAKLTARNLATLLKNPGAALKAYKPSAPICLITIGPKNGAVQVPFGHPHFLAAIKQKDLFVGMYLK